MTALNKQALRDSALDMISVLGYIASFESEDIDGDDLELRFETEDGLDTGCTISITSQCQDASDVMHQLLNELEAAENELNACKSILEKIKSTSCHVDTSPGAFIPNSLDAWGRPVPQYLSYDFSGNTGASATQYCNGWNDAGCYWLNHVKYLQECIRAAGIGVKGE